jgi:hypothetical protein
MLMFKVVPTLKSQTTLDDGEGFRHSWLPSNTSTAGLGIATNPSLQCMTYPVMHVS